MLFCVILHQSALDHSVFFYVGCGNKIANLPVIVRLAVLNTDYESVLPSDYLAVSNTHPSIALIPALIAHLATARRFAPIIYRFMHFCALCIRRLVVSKHGCVTCKQKWRCWACRALRGGKLYLTGSRVVRASPMLPNAAKNLLDVLEDFKARSPLFSPSADLRPG